MSPWLSSALDVHTMTRVEFIGLLHKASVASVDFARRYVRNRLPDTYRYHLALNQSFDGHATPEERVFPEDDGREHTSVSMEGVADLLLRDGRCPEWIDVSVEAEGADYTLLRLLCCGRYSEDRSRMYYTDRGMGPFGIKSPTLPPGYADEGTFTIPKVQPGGTANQSQPVGPATSQTSPAAGSGG
jgi:hypothetical protein